MRNECSCNQSPMLAHDGLPLLPVHALLADTRCFRSRAAFRPGKNQPGKNQPGKNHIRLTASIALSVFFLMSTLHAADEVPAAATAIAQAAEPQAANAVTSRLSQSDNISINTDRLVPANEGDTLADIAERYFGSRALARQIAEHNNLDVATVLGDGFEVRLPRSEADMENGVVVLFHKGQVLHSKGGGRNALPLHAASLLRVHDELRTGKHGFATLQFANGSVLNVQPLSRVRIGALACAERDDECLVTLDIEGGGINANVSKQGSGPRNSRFIVNTPYASAAVRGTLFDFDADRSKLRVGVTDGSVDISSNLATTNDSTNLSTGLGTVVEAGKLPSDPVRLLPATRFQRLPLRLSAEDTITWNPLPGAEHYELVVALNAAGSPAGEGVLLRRQTTATESLAVSIDAVEAGAYHLNLRGLDSLGLKGFQSSQAVRFVEIDDAYPVPSASSAQDSEGVYLSVSEWADDVVAYEFQLAVADTFGDVQSADISDPSTGLVVASVASNSQASTLAPRYARVRAVLSDSRVSRFSAPILLP